MSSRNLTRLIGSSLIVTSTMVGCSGAQMQNRPAIVSTQASVIATGVEQALASHDFAHALLEAERLVEASPREASYRTLLGRAYLANGRYQSARTAFEDAMALGANDPRTIVSLALVRTGLGDAQGAHQLLAAHIGDLPANDYGLGMTMTGDTQEGGRALMEAVHLPDANARTRQNLAYALAISGNWAQARLVAGQDLAGSALQQRLSQWAATAQPDAAPQRIAALLGVAPRPDDSGLPARLALSASEAPALAAAKTQPTDLVASAAAAQQPVTAEAAPEPAPATDENAPQVAAAFPSDAPLIHAQTDSMRTAVMARMAASDVPARSGASNARARASFASATLPLTRTDAPKTGSDWVVQIGAFRDGRTAALGWKSAHGQRFEAHGYRKVTATIALNGKTFTRLAMSGFGNRDAAVALCGSLRAEGQSCFVRRDAGVAEEMRMARASAAPKVARANRGAKVAAIASVKPEKIASR